MMDGMDSAVSHTIGLALGANLGDRLAALRAARHALEPYVALDKVSPIYETQPAYVSDQPAFLNAVLMGSTALEPLPLLYTVKEIERALGRQPTYRYGPRAIDIDILFYDATRTHTAELTLPHPRLAERAFVLRPLADIAPDWVHPTTGSTARAMLDALGATPDVRAFGEQM